MPDTDTATQSNTTGTAPTQSHWQGLADLFTAGPVSKTVQIIFGSDLSGVVARLSGALLVAGNVYARPLLIGVVLLVLGSVTVGWAVHKNKWTGVTRILSLVIISIGVCFTVFHNWILKEELETVSSYSIASLNSFPVGRILDQKTLSKTTHGALVRVRLAKVELSKHAQGPTPVVVMDSTGLSDKPGEIQTALNTEAATLTTVIPARNALTFLIGPSGTGKETLLRQWVYALGSASDTQSGFTHIFLLTGEDLAPFISNEKKGNSVPSLQDVLAFAYKGIVDSATYFDLLLRNDRCLIVLTDWDAIAKPDRQLLLRKAAELVASKEYKVSILLSTRPDALLRDFSVDDANTFRYEPFLRFLYLQPWQKDEWDEYFRRRELPVEGDHYDKTEKLIAETGGSLGVPGQLAANLELLNLMVEEVDEVSKLDSFALCRRLTNRVLERSPELHPDDVYKQAVTSLHRLAYEASQHNTGDLEFAGHIDQMDQLYLSKSGLADIDAGSFRFTLSIVHSYMALEGLRDYNSQQLLLGRL